MYYRIFKTSLGWAGIAGSETGIAFLELPQDDKEATRKALISKASTDSQETESAFSSEVEALISYFGGNRVDFECKMDTSHAPEFDLSVWNAARRIPYGEVVNYSWIAEQIGRPKASRAVGQALGRNPVPIIVPCHRVLRKDGGLGGFNCGLDWKRRLLSMENAG